jgi:hypothetical protein
MDSKIFSQNVYALVLNTEELNQIDASMHTKLGRLILVNFASCR